MCVKSLFWLIFVETIFFNFAILKVNYIGACLVTSQKGAEGNHVSLTLLNQKLSINFTHGFPSVPCAFFG